MIYTLTPNPCLDYVMDCDNMLYGETNRSKHESITFGGKGINVSVVLKELDVMSTALGFVGGFTGDELEKLVRRTGIQTDFVHVSQGNTRINVKIKGKDITEINAAGFEITENELDELYNKLDTLAEGDTLILAGSAPKGAPDDIYEKICQRLIHKNIRLVIDTTGQKLLNCLKYKPFLIKPNKAELGEMFDTVVKTKEEITLYAQKLQKMGAQNVLVSMGGEGAMLVTCNEDVFEVASHKIIPVNTVGAGDSMVAGFLAGIDKGYEYALKLGNACGAATAKSARLATIDVVNDLMTQ